jgi:membrane protease YdiL (CAAX protease family)
MSAVMDWFKTPHLPDSRGLSACEFLLGAAIVIGHNVFHVVPNEVPILFVLGVVSLRVRSGGWAALGFKRPKSWLVLLSIAVGAAILRLGLGEVVEAVGASIWPAPEKAPAGFNAIAGHPLVLLKWFGIVWTFAAFGEEISYRSYLVTRGADLGGRSTLAYWLAIVVVAVLFGYGHYYKGPVGVVDSGIAGLILGAAYMLSGRNLWACVLAHGLIDSVGLVFAYTG